jgi:hypothetical protein
MMKTILFYFILSVLSIFSINAQSLVNYAFSTSSTAVLENMSSGTTQLIAGSSVDVASAITDIGFTFHFMGVPYSQFSVNSNGQLSLGSTLISATAIDAPVPNTPLIVPISGGNSILSTGKVHYMVKGVAPNRILIVEWKNLNIPVPILDGNPPIAEYNPSTIQVYLYESVGIVEFKYGVINNNSLPTVTKSSFISSSNIVNTVKYIGPDMISAIDAITIGTYPLNTVNMGLLTNRLYSFVPPIAPLAPTLKPEPITAIAANSLTLNWNDLSNNETGFLIYCSTDGGATFSYVATAPANTTSYVINGALADINNQWQITAVNEGAISSLILIASKTLSLSSVMLEGLYNGSGTMRQAMDAVGPHWTAGIADHITVELHTSAIYATIVYSATDVPLSTTGAATVTIPANNGSYYITVKHRNSIETTTATAISFTGNTISHSFGIPVNVFGGNLGLSVDNFYVIYGGDVNQDGFVDTRDYTLVDNNSASISKGYLTSDVDGNGIVDTRDYTPIDNNNGRLSKTKHP